MTNSYSIQSHPSTQTESSPIRRRITPVLIQPTLVPLPSVPLLQDSETDSEPEKECIICYESLSMKKNLCITECGHEFCFSCMMKHVQRNNGCPICRSTIIDDVEDSESENDDYSEISGSEEDSDEDDESIDVIDIDEDNNEYSIEQFEESFTARGYGLKDALSILIYKFSKTDEKYTKSYIKKLEKDMDHIHDELQRELNEREEMATEDTLERETSQLIQ